MIHRLKRAFIALVAATTFGFVAQAQQPQSQARFAFVIGNDGYEGAELPTAANDAALVADMLKSAGFDVTGARNLDRETFGASYREFLERVAAAGGDALAFVYVNGYGLQSEGENYFIPPGARVARAAELPLHSLRLTDLTRSLGGLPAQARILAFDLAYAGPFARDGQAPPQGLAIMEAGPGDLVTFNAAPGVVAPTGQPPYGAFAQALAEMAREPGTPIADVFNRVRVRVAELTRGAQAPWHESRIERPVILFERGGDAPPPAVSQAEIDARRARPMQEVGEAEAYALALDRDTIRGYEDFLALHPKSPYARNVRNILATRREALTWRRTVQSNTAAAYWSYLDRYPKGPNAPAARARLARLQAALDPPPSYDPIDYDVAPPAADELVYFVGEGPRYFEPVEAPIEIVYLAPRPMWWRPPPPPIYVEESYYYLPAPVPVVAPAWIAPPLYVRPPPPPLHVLPPEPGLAVNPYVAAPIALAAGLAAGSIIHRRDRLAREGVSPGRPFLPPIARPPHGRPQTLPAALQPQNLQNFQQRPRPLAEPRQGGAGAASGKPSPGLQGLPEVRRLPEARPSGQRLRPGQPGFVAVGQQGAPGERRQPDPRPTQTQRTHQLQTGRQPEIQRPQQQQVQMQRQQQQIQSRRQQDIQMQRQQQIQSRRQQDIQMQRQQQIQSRRQQEIQMQRQQQIQSQRQQEIQMQRQQQIHQSRRQQEIQMQRQQQIQSQRQQQMQRQQQQMQQQRPTQTRQQPCGRPGLPRCS